MVRRLRRPRVAVASGSFRWQAGSRRTATVRIDSVGTTSRYGRSASTAAGSAAEAASAVNGWTGMVRCGPSSPDSPSCSTVGHQAGSGAVPATVSAAAGIASQRSANDWWNSGA